MPRGNTATATRTVTVTGARSVDLNATVAMDMLWVPAGTFTMGSPTSEAGRQSDREDEHSVTLTKGFYLGKYEVTQAQYEAVMTGVRTVSPTPSEWPNNPNRPVEKVSWNDAQVFLYPPQCERTSGGSPARRLELCVTHRIPMGICLPCRYDHGILMGDDSLRVRMQTIMQVRINQTVNVGLYAANPWGFFDMHGNVWEWTADRYQAAYPTGNPVIDPNGTNIGLDPGHSRWFLARRRGVLAFCRAQQLPRHRHSNLGFRVSFQKSQ